MTTVGIIAEYNPFHNGHAYQIETVRKITGANHVVVVMSGNFVQRGTPAWTDKFLRTKMALSCGADLVFELPVVFATASAEEFAYGGVSLLNALGCIDYLCFGSECGNLEALSKIASFLCNPDEQFQSRLTTALRSGITYPAARAALLAEQFPELHREIPNLIEEPNNILGIEYLKALFRLNSHIKPITISRIGNGYHSLRSEGNYLSASAIRKHFLMNTSAQPSEKFSPSTSVPKSVYELLQNHPKQLGITEDDFSEMLYYKLRTMDESSLEIADMTPELWHRIKSKRGSYTTFSSFASSLKTKQYTYTRICRVLLHLLLDIKHSRAAEHQMISAQYARLLGFRTGHTDLLRNVTQIPVITKLADAETQLASHAPSSEKAKEHLNTDLLASDLFRQVLYHKKQVILPSDYQANVIRTS